MLLCLTVSPKQQEDVKVRAKDDMSYQDYKDDATTSFRLHEEGWNAFRITEYITATSADAGLAVGTSIALQIISIGEYEIRNNLLEDRVLEQLSYHIPRFMMGKYDDDLTPEEHQQIEKDVDFILSKVKLYDNIDLSDDEDSDLPY